MNTEKMIEQIYEEVKKLSSETSANTKALKQLDKKVDRLEGRIIALEERVDRLEGRITAQEETAQTIFRALRGQADRNFQILEQDLGAAMDGMIWLKEHKVDKNALKQATI